MQSAVLWHQARVPAHSETEALHFLCHHGHEHDAGAALPRGSPSRKCGVRSSISDLPRVLLHPGGGKTADTLAAARLRKDVFLGARHLAFAEPVESGGGGRRDWLAERLE